MSALDIAGAVVSAFILLITTLVWMSEAYADYGPTTGGKNAFVISLVALGWLIFCIARLFGAHL